jgi:hypothetical protein
MVNFCREVISKAVDELDNFAQANTDHPVVRVNFTLTNHYDYALFC